MADASALLPLKIFLDLKHLARNITKTLLLLPFTPRFSLLRKGGEGVKRGVWGERRGGGGNRRDLGI
jgi:hypothetical protein